VFGSICRRVIHLALVVVIVSFATMVMVDLVPGGIASAILGDQATPEQIVRVNHELHLDENYVNRYATWIGDVATGDFGTSPRTNRPVLDTISSRLPVTVELLVLTQLMALTLAIPIGLITAHRQGKMLDRFWVTISSISIATPAFVLALVLSYFFAVRWHFFPVSGWVPIGRGVFDNLRSLFLPAFTLAVGETAIYSRVLRSDAVTTMRQDYMLAARARGLSPSRVMFRHALRPSSLSLVTLSALSIGRLIGGAVVVETIFALPGLGQLMIDSILSSDLIVVQGIVLFVALVYVSINMGLDVAYGYLDPRVRKRAA
jgi:peptide/nickel transport system permease protein